MKKLKKIKSSNPYKDNLTKYETKGQVGLNVYPAPSLAFKEAVQKNLSFPTIEEILKKNEPAPSKNQPPVYSGLGPTKRVVVSNVDNTRVQAPVKKLTYQQYKAGQEHIKILEQQGKEELARRYAVKKAADEDFSKSMLGRLIPDEYEKYVPAPFGMYPMIPTDNSIKQMRESYRLNPDDPFDLFDDVNPLNLYTHVAANLYDRAIHPVEKIWKEPVGAALDVADAFFLKGVASLGKKALVSMGKSSARQVAKVANRFGFESPFNLNNVRNEVNLLEGLPANKNATIVAEPEPTPWILEEPQTNTLQIKSTMQGSPLEKQLSKSGEINVNNIRSHLNKAEVGQQDKFILDKVLNEKFPNQTKIDYNEFRKAVSDELVPLNNQVVQYKHSNWGVDRLGYPKPKKASFDLALEQTQKNIARLEQDLINYEKSLSNPNPSVMGTEGRKGFLLTDEQIRNNIKLQLDQEKERLLNIINNSKELPLDQQAITYSNPSKFGRGSADHFDETTLGHSRTLVSKENPDTMHILEQQSDYWQKRQPDAIKLTDAELERLAKAEDAHKLKLEHHKYMKETGKDYHGNIVSEDQLLQLEKETAREGRNLQLKRGEISNVQQKEFLGKAHQERLLQENAIYAAKEGKTKMRYPTRETAIKVQGYEPYSEAMRLQSQVENLNYLLKNDEFLQLADDTILPINDYGYRRLSTTPLTKVEYLQRVEEEITRLQSLAPEELNRLVFHPQHETILKKYMDTPKMIKKTLGKDVKTVTDAKGNSWYEFDIPDKIREGKYEIRAFKLGGENRKDNLFPKYSAGGQTELEEIDPVIESYSEKIRSQAKLNSLISKMAKDNFDWTNRSLPEVQQYLYNIQVPALQSVVQEFGLLKPENLVNVLGVKNKRINPMLDYGY